MSNATPAVVAGALGLLACYGSSLPDDNQQPLVQVERSQKLQNIADQIHSVIRDARNFEETFRAIARKYAKNDPRQYLDSEGVTKLAGVLESVRWVEAGLADVEAPEPLAALHMDLRRALARGRSWLTVSHDLARQAFEVPEVAESRLNGDGVRALAKHSTQRLVGMANA